VSNMKLAATGAISLGLLLLLLSAAWTSIFPASARWTPDKEEQAQKVKSRLHSLSFVVDNPKYVSTHSASETGKTKAEFEALKQENEQLNADFSSAYGGPRTTAKALQWSGISLAVVGIIGWYAVNQSR
jgi:hypothetical protein